MQVDAGVEDGGSSGPLNLIFGPPDCGSMALEANVNLSGYRSDRYAWDDPECARRSAALGRNDAADPGNSRGGYLRELVYSVNGTTRTARGTC